MRIYTAHLHDDRPAVLVPEAFAWGALFFGPLWLLRHGAWLVAIVALAVLILACTVVPPPLRPAATFCVLVVLGLFGNDLWRWSLGRRRFEIGHVVAGRTDGEAEFRLLQRMVAERERRAAQREQVVALRAEAV